LLGQKNVDAAIFDNNNTVLRKASCEVLEVVLVRE
jgi:hypothetical protein